MDSDAFLNRSDLSDFDLDLGLIFWSWQSLMLCMIRLIIINFNHHLERLEHHINVVLLYILSDGFTSVYISQPSDLFILRYECEVLFFFFDDIY